MCAESVILAKTVFRHAVSLRPGIHHSFALVPAVLEAAEQPFFFLFRVNGQIAFDQVEIICPVVAPVALGEFGAGFAVGRADDLGRKGRHFFGGHSRVLGGHGDLTGGEGTGKQRRFSGKRLSELFPCAVVQRVDAGGDDEGVVAVGLNQLEEGVDILRANLRGEQNVTAAILVDVPEIAVALSVVFFPEREIIVFPLRVAVLPGVEVIGHLLFPVPEKRRHAAPEEVVQPALLRVGVENRIGGPGGYGGAQFVC